MEKLERKITVETTYRTQDGNVFGTESEAIQHERYLTLLEILGKHGCDLSKDVKASIYMLSNHFDEALDLMYERKVLSSYYGRQGDF